MTHLPGQDRASSFWIKCTEKAGCMEWGESFVVTAVNVDVKV